MYYSMKELPWNKDLFPNNGQNGLLQERIAHKQRLITK